MRGRAGDHHSRETMLFARSCILLSLTLRVCHAELGWQARDGALTAQVHLAQLKPDGSLAGIPEGAQVVLEIGANTRNTLDRELLPQRPDAFLITFEPLLDKCAAQPRGCPNPSLVVRSPAHETHGCPVHVHASSSICTPITCVQVRCPPGSQLAA